jgi:hypothetical protein
MKYFARRFCADVWVATLEKVKIQLKNKRKAARE